MKHEILERYKVLYDKTQKNIEMLKAGTLPSDFNHWERIVDHNGTTLGHLAVTLDKISPTFDKWELVDYDGVSVATLAASLGRLPLGFDKWDIADSTGWSVAHTAARYGALPKDFNRWELTNNDGWTVAHTAAAHGHLPENFEKDFPKLLRLMDHNGVSVSTVISSCNRMKE